jgi:hypothetical protein
VPYQRVVLPHRFPDGRPVAVVSQLGYVDIELPVAIRSSTR